MHMHTYSNVLVKYNSNKITHLYASYNFMYYLNEKCSPTSNFICSSFRWVGEDLGRILINAG